MATRGAIGITEPGVGIRAIYVHYDMYPDYTGAVLVNHYNSRERAEGLLALGHLEGIDPVLEQCDRMSGDTEPLWELPWLDFMDKARNVGCQFVYVWDTEDGSWACWSVHPTEMDLTKYEERVLC